MVLPLYGICDTGDYWHVTVMLHFEEDLGMVLLVSDPAWFFQRTSVDEVMGMLGAFVDDCFVGGDNEFQDLPR